MSEPHQLYTSLSIDTDMDSVLKFYPINSLPSILNKRTGKAKKTKYEEIDNNLYDPEARMVAFHTTLERIIIWLKALEILYYDNLGKSDDLKVTWTDMPDTWIDRNNLSNQVVIDVYSNTSDGSADETRLYKLRFFVTTGTMQVQGNLHDTFTSSHFPVLKQLVDMLTNKCSINSTENAEEQTLEKRVVINTTESVEEETQEKRVVTNSTESSKEETLKKRVAENQSTKASPTANNSIMKDLNNIKQKIELQLRVNTDIISSLNKIEGKCCQIDELNESTRSNTTNIKSLQAEKEKMDSRVKSLENQYTHMVQTNNASSRQINHLELQLKNRTSEKDTSYIEKLTERDRHIAKLDKQCAIFDNDNNKLKSMSKDVENRCETLETKVRDLEYNNRKLKEQNLSLMEENKTLASKITPSVADKETTPLRNYYVPLSSLSPNDDDVSITGVFNGAQPDLVIIADSHGRSIDAKKLYKNKVVEIKILDNGKKNLAGAKEFINKADTVGKQTILLVGSNDIAEKAAPDVLQEVHNLCDTFKTKFPNGCLNIVPPLPRADNEQYNKEASMLYNKLNQVCCDNISIIRNDEINSSDHSMYVVDKVHLSSDGSAKLARVLKRHMNPKLGLPRPEYSAYPADNMNPIRRSFNEPRSRFPQNRQRSNLFVNRQNNFGQDQGKRDLILQLLGL